MPQQGFSLFIQQLFSLYENSLREPDMNLVIIRCDRVLNQLKNYKPTDDDEEINIETAIELFEELLSRAKLRLKLGH